MFVYIILVLNCFISNMVVGVFGEARGAYSRPAPDLTVLERFKLQRRPSLITQPFPSPLLYPTFNISCIFIIIIISRNVLLLSLL